MDNEDYTPKNMLGVADLATFAFSIVVSCAIGIYYAYKDRKNSTTDNYYYGGGKMNAVAVGLSIAVTFRSAVTVIASPAEAYITGTAVLWEEFLTIFTSFITMIYFIPAFRRMQLNTIFQYLEFRFSAELARLAGFMYSIATVFYMGTIIYLPAVSLNAVTAIPLTLSIVLTGGICTLYTTLGGMKAVVWSDVFQSSIMLIGMFAVTIQGLITIGGFGEMGAALERGERYTELRFDYGIFSRISPTAVLVGNFVFALDTLCFSQPVMQRYLSCRSTTQAQLSLLIYIFPTILISLLVSVNGFIMYAYFEGCDPVMSGILQKIDQGIPYLVLKLFENIPGLTGLFISAIFSASLSTVSSCLNSLSVVLLEDCFVKRWPNLSESIKLIIGKTIVLAIGIVSIITALLISIVRSNALELVYGFSGLIQGPLDGAYILGFFFPWANKYGAFAGVFSGVALLSFIFFGNHIWNIDPYSANIPPRTIELCSANNTNQEQFSNFTSMVMPETISVNAEEGRSILSDVLNLNFNIHMFVGCFVSLLVGLAVSFLTGHTSGSEANPNYFIPIVDNKCLPIKVRKFFRFGVPELSRDEANISLSQRNGVVDD
uniref:sodium-coupled monocarboxylate transporter 1-like isoform X1 n=1 Tax=Styela clava TaxID=7725 RepID=UPI001939B86B|nr:sodium-coupled monocarboxylate transporter 1-like isoform X1 [Styela clava]